MPPASTLSRRRREEAALPDGGPPDWDHRLRAHFLFACLLTAFLCIGVRLAYLHLSPHWRLTEQEQAHIGYTDLVAPRGEILDRDGQILATQKKALSLWADPSKLISGSTRVDVPQLALLLSTHLSMEEEEVARRLSMRDSKGRPRRFVWIKRWLEPAEQAGLDELLAKGGGALDLREEPVRYYPQGDTAAHLLGFVNRVGEASEGVELTFDRHLKVVPGSRRARKDVHTRLLSTLTLEYTPPQGGDSLHLTIDSTIQHRLEQALDERIKPEVCNAKRGMGLIMDAHTGAVIALATRPAFDPNHYDEYDPGLRKNRAVLDLFEPGSAFKIVTAAAVLEHGLVHTDTIIDCEGGSFNPYGHRINDFHKFDEPIPFTKCFAESSNIAMVKVAAMLGDVRLEQWIRRFGFGERSARDFRFESAGLFRPVSRWSRLSMGSLPIGQEISVTMLQLAQSFAVIANGGFLVEPHFVERAVSREGLETYRYEAPPKQRIISSETARIMRELCHLVVHEGTGSRASIPEYRVGGKTGTAQIAKPDGTGYYEDRYTTVFAGFAPVSDPRLVGVIVVQEPMIDLHYGGYVCGPVFREVMRDALVRLHVPEDPVRDADAPQEVDNGAPVLAQSREDGASETPAKPGQDVDLAAGRPESTQALAPQRLDSLELVAAAGDPVAEGGGLPDLRGMNKREAKEQLALLGIPWDPQGAGWVVRQSPPPGTPLEAVTLCALEFGPRTLPILESDESSPST